MTTFLCKKRSLFKVSGPDAHKLLNDVFTGTIPEKTGEAHWWALLSPQGKIQAEGLISLQEEAYWLDVHEDVSPKFFKRMGMYKLRADAAILDMSDSHRVGWAMETSDNFADKDQRHDQLGFRIIAEKAETDSWEQSNTAYQETRTRLGIPELGTDFASDSLFPHDIGMDLLKGVDFSKGCYVGQEVVSRMRHKANVRRRPVIVETQGAGLGEILFNDKTVGQIGPVIDGGGIGIVRLDRIKDPSATTINGNSAKLTIPSWADYDFASNSNPDK